MNSQRQVFSLQSSPTHREELFVLSKLSSNHLELREYMFSLFRMRGLDNLLATRPNAKDVTRYMANTSDVWSKFRKFDMRIGDDDLHDLMEVYESGRIAKCEDLVSFVKDFLFDRPTGILYYTAYF